MTRRRSAQILVLLAAIFLASSGWTSVGAQEEETGWKNVAELTLVVTGGNATSNTLGFRSTSDYRWPDAAFQLTGGALRARSGRVVRTATGTPQDFQISETTQDRTTAESYFVRGRFDRDLSEAAFVFAGAGWERNTFAGFDNRYALVSGAGRSWFDEDTRRFKTDLGLTYTVQDDVVENPDAADSFLGARGSYDYSRRLTETTDFASVLVADQNLEETEDFRADWTNSVAVAMSERLALKTSLQLLYDKSPALVAVPLEGADAEVLVPLKEVDTVFTVAVVVSF